jgi:hypothetical protein
VQWGAPIKKGASGCIFNILPGIGSIVTFAPKMNNHLTSVKGFEYLMKLDQIFSNFNLFQKDQLKQDLSRKSYQTKIQTTIAICSAAAVGDINEIFRLFNQNSDMN